LPDGTKVYISDDSAGDARASELYEKHGNLKLEACYKDQPEAKSLDDLKPFWTGTIEEQYS
jgi:ABC-type metal ion transport system substrate-binding protein